MQKDGWEHKITFNVRDKLANDVIEKHKDNPVNKFYRFVTERGNFIYTLNPSLFDKPSN